MKVKQANPEDALKVRRFKANQLYRQRRERMGFEKRKRLTAEGTLSSMRPIVMATCRLFNIRPELFYSQERSGLLCFARRVAFEAARHMGHSYTVIAFGTRRRCHTTVVSVVQKFNQDETWEGITGREYVARVVRDVMKGD